MSSLLPDYYRQGIIPGWIPPSRFLNAGEQLSLNEKERLVAYLATNGRLVFESNVLTKLNNRSSLDDISVSCYLSLTLSLVDERGSSTGLSTTYP